MNESAEMRATLEAELRQIENRLEKIERDRRRENNQLSDDWEEQATVRQNDEVLDGLEVESRQQVEAIRDALARMDEGTYGFCATCGARIAKARIAALPHATLCITCAEKKESSG